MHIYLRKSYPYYGKFKIKVNFEIPGKYSNNSMDVRNWIGKIIKFLENNVSEESFKATLIWGPTSYWEVYLKDFEQLEIVKKKYNKYIWSLYKPAPGYEHLEGRAPKEERILYYNRYPYRIVFNLEKNKVYELVEWCEENTEGDFRKSGYSDNVSFFFMRASDAALMKLVWGDFVNSTHMPDSSKVEALLRQNVTNAESDLSEFIEGIKELGLN